MNQKTAHPCLHLLLLLLAAVSVAQEQDAIEQRSVVVEFRPGSGAAGEAEAGVSLAVKPRGPRVVLYAHARHDSANLRLRVEDSAGKILAEDDDSGGGTIPWLKLELEKAAELRVEVIAAEQKEPLSCTLQLVQVHESAETLKALGQVAADLAAAAAAHTKKEFGESRRMVAAVVDELLALPGFDESAAAADTLFEAAERAKEAGLLELESAAREGLLAFQEQVMPTEHPVLVKSQQSYGSNLMARGKHQEGKVLYDHVLEVRTRTLPPEHPAVLGAMVNCAWALKSLGDLRAARTLEEEALKIHERIVPDDDAALQLTRRALAATLGALGDLPGSAALLKKVLDVQERTVPDDDADLRRTRGNYAIALYNLGDVEGAQELFQKVLAASERTLPEEHPEFILARKNQAIILAEIGDVRGVAELEKKLLDVYERTLPDDHPDLMNARLNYASDLKGLGELQAAKQIEEEFLAAHEGSLPESDPHLRLARMNYATTLLHLGDMHGAREIQEKLLASLRRTLPARHPDLLFVQVTYAVTLEALGDLEGARSLLEKSIAVLEKDVPEHDAVLVQARSSHATTLMALGDVQRAKETLERNLEIVEAALPADHHRVLHARTALAGALQQLGEIERATQLARQILDAKARTLPADHPGLLEARMNYSSMLQLQGDFEGARVVLAPTLEVMKRTLPEDSPMLLNARNNQAALLFGLGKLRAAREIYTEVLAIYVDTLPRGHPSLQDVRHGLAGVLASLGEGEPLVALLRGMGEDLLHQQTRYIPQVSFRQAGTLAGGLNRYVNSMLDYSSFVPEGSRRELDVRILAAIETSRCAESAARRLARLAPEPGSEPGLRAASLRRAAAQANTAITHYVEAPDGRAALREAIFDKEKAETELVELLSKQPGAGPLLESTTAAALARALEPGEAAVSYWTYWKLEWRTDKAKEGIRQPGPLELNYVAFVVRDDGAVTRVNLGPADKLDRRVAAWRTLVRNEGAAALLVQAQALREEMLDPVLEAAGDVERLYVALDESLHLVALDSLPQKDDGLVGDHVQVHVVTALRDLLLIEQDAPPASPSLLAAGAIDYAGSSAVRPQEPVVASLHDGPPREALRGDSLDPLPASGDEVKAVAAVYGNAFGAAQRATVLTGNEPTRQAFLDRAPGTRFLHLATHAWFAPDDLLSLDDKVSESAGVRGSSASVQQTVRGYAPMLLCGVALAGAGAEAEQTARAGILTAQEISGLDLGGCELAVLSACETSLGSRRPGQGVASLQQALHAAGVRMSLTSLWKVPDTATRSLMEEFYRRLWQGGEEPHRALWEAKRKLREAKGPDGKSLHTPRDWAGWVLCGVSAEDH